VCGPSHSPAPYLPAAEWPPKRFDKWQEKPNSDKVEWINSALDEKIAAGRGDYSCGVTELIKAQERRDNE
jgi:hypothetical protein